ncbi:MAG: carboxymethylenebutenolidase [Gammaproteobacteria bacterium RIFCSPHIGHO2_12_FULL_42_13]|nr:MAG: carboxymethylenebutenolidase [Gammaproteobacteria bacterium RIFCSPHIGHO2_12_FULL_42_13]
MLNTQNITYQDGSATLDGYCAFDDNFPGKKPAVLVVHDWTGRNDFAMSKAEKLAKLGYVGFALDMYGHAKCGQTKEEKMGLMQPFMQDRSLLRQRILAALDAVKYHEAVDANRIAAIGFCFGGLCVLDLARSGANIKGVVSFHGLLNPPENLPSKKIIAKVLALHGAADPMVTIDQVAAFTREMTEAHTDWQIDIYGNVMHAFTNPEANDPDFGTVYNATADKRSWIAMQNFFTEILSDELIPF